MKNAYHETATSNRYDSGRRLPTQTKNLWLEALLNSLPKQSIGKILDFGCGTVRFTLSLSEAFGCPVVDDSDLMLYVATSQNEPSIERKQGQAEEIPLENESVNLVFMSHVFHHLALPESSVSPEETGV